MEDSCKVIRTYHYINNEKIKEEYFVINNKINGEYKKYYENGQLLLICNYIDGKRNGEYKAYYDNGQFIFL